MVARHRQLAYEAARLMADDLIEDFEHARRKAAEQLGITDKRQWPDNLEIQQQLLERQRLFGGAARQRECRALLEQALAAMQVFAPFQPRLVGAALAGTATYQQGFELQVFADSPEEVIWRLIDRKIPWSVDQGQFRYAGNQRLEHPILRFLAGMVPVQIVVLPIKARRNPPLDPVSNRPQRGASPRDLEDQLARDNPCQNAPINTH
ncbi:hypothetical protein CKO36_11120 [Rhabdochromatium marinum]|nr:hypothetical protein [Rhabdochromatium marinum]